MTRSAKKRPVSDAPVRTLAELSPGSRGELLAPSNYGGSMRPALLAKGTAVLVTAHSGDPIRAVLVRLDAPGSSGPYFLSPSTPVRVLSERAVSQNVAPQSEIDPLLRSVS